jgi:cytochrome P450
MTYSSSPPPAVTHAGRIEQAQLPGPSTPLGILSEFQHVLRFFSDPVAVMRNHWQTHGAISGLNGQGAASARRLIFAFGPTYNQQILSQPDVFHSSSMLNVPHPSVQRLTAGLTFLNGDAHKSRRRLVMPHFHRQYIQAYRDDMVSLTGRMLDTWQVGNTRDMARDAHQLTARIAIKTLFGLDGDAAAARMHHLIESWMGLAVSPMLRAFPFNLPGTVQRRLRQVSDELESDIRALIAEKRRDPARYTDLMAMLLQSRDEDGGRLSEDDLIGQTNVLFLAGHETSGNALGWTLFLLAQHPHILRDVRDELDGVLGGAPPTIAQLDALPLLERVIKESMRVLPPVVWIQRIVQEPVTLGGYDLPRGATVILSHYITHHLPDLYPQPERFDPARWEAHRPRPYEYMAFSAGPRMCIGSAFAMMELKIVLAMILQRFHLTMAPDARVDRQVTVTLSPRHGLPMQIHPPDHRPAVQPVSGNIHEMVDLPAG